MKKPMLCFVLLLSANFLFAQGSITFNPVIPNVIDGVVEFTIDLVGGGAQYDLSVEVSFNNGVNWDDIPTSAITGNLNNVIPATGIALQWDALTSFPGQVTNNARLRVTARHVCGTDFTFTYRGSPVTYGTVLVDYGGSVGERCWMDRNLGATQVATASDDASSYGDLFQWGRLDDGHQDRAGTTTSTLSTTDVPGHDKFIPAPSLPYDWRSPQNDNLWQGVNGVNNPCPPGFRLPTEVEWGAELESWISSNSAGAIASPLKLPLAGLRYYYDGSIYNEGTTSHYWSSAVDNFNSQPLHFNTSGAHMSSHYRAYGYSVRCIKE